MPFKTYLEVLRSGNPLRFALLINISKAFTVVASSERTTGCRLLAYGGFFTT